MCVCIRRVDACCDRWRCDRWRWRPPEEASEHPISSVVRMQKDCTLCLCWCAYAYMFRHWIFVHRSAAHEGKVTVYYPRVQAANLVTLAASACVMIQRNQNASKRTCGMSFVFTHHANIFKPNGALPSIAHSALSAVLSCQSYVLCSHAFNFHRSCVDVLILVLVPRLRLARGLLPRLLHHAIPQRSWLSHQTFRFSAQGWDCLWLSGSLSVFLHVYIM